MLLADDDVVMEEREELMVSPTGGDVIFRRAHFLRPTVTSINDAVAAPSLSCSATPSANKYKDLPFKVNYHGWKHPPENWKSWVDRLHTLHHSTWKRAGILDAIITSKCTIHRYEGLILELVEKWCPKTNSFVFPWGEATITLEDLMVLGGYSVLGESVLIPPEDEEMEEIVKKLVAARSNISKGKAKNAVQSRWIAQFMGSGSEIEHEALLAYWLSRFIFPFSRYTISRRVLSIAAHLARGTQIALAPSILATIYKSLTFLKAAIISARKSAAKEGQNGVLHVTVPAPLELVQVWIWERFPSLRPKPESIGENKPRLARWDNLKLSSEYRLLTIDSAGKDFQWRPYTTTESNVFPRLVYMENEGWEMVDSDLEGFVRCLRTSELVSLEQSCIEHYLPHRVAMQFGMDQELPGDVARVNANPEIAWRHYSRPIRDAKLYVPPRVSEPCVTTRYLAWWKSNITDANGKSSDKDSELEKDLFGRKWEGDFFTPPPGFSLKWKKVQKAGAISDQVVQRESLLCSSTATNDGKGSSLKLKIKLPRKFVDNDSDPPLGGKGSSKSSKRRRKFVVSSSSGESSDYNDCDPPPGFAPKHSQEKASHSGTSTRIEEKVAQRTSSGSYGNDHSRDDAQGKNNHLSSTANNGNIQEIEAVEARMDDKSGSSPSEGSGPSERGLEERMTTIEKLVALIEAGKLVCL